MSLLGIQASGTQELQTRLTALGDDAPNAVVRALERASTTVTTRLLRWMVAATGLPLARIRKSMRRTKPARGLLESTITLYGGRSPLIKYRETVQRAHFPRSAFRARMPGSGHIGIFERRAGSRHRRVGEPFAPHELPIDVVLGPAFTEFLTGVGLDDLLAYGGARLELELEREVAFRESRQARAA
jgi:hypothetical protein